MFFNKFRSTKLKHSRKFRTASYFMKGNYWNYFLPRCCCFFRTWKIPHSCKWEFHLYDVEMLMRGWWKCYADRFLFNVAHQHFCLLIFPFCYFFLPVSELRGEVKRTKIRACINAWKCEMWKCTVREVKCSKNKQRLWKCEEIKISKKGKLLLFMESDSENCYIKWKYLSG